MDFERIGSGQLTPYRGGSRSQARQSTPDRRCHVRSAYPQMPQMCKAIRQGSWVREFSWSSTRAEYDMSVATRSRYMCSPYLSTALTATQCQNCHTDSCYICRKAIPEGYVADLKVLIGLMELPDMSTSIEASSLPSLWSLSVSS